MGPKGLGQVTKAELVSSDGKGILVEETAEVKVRRSATAENFGDLCCATDGRRETAHWIPTAYTTMPDC